MPLYSFRCVNQHVTDRIFHIAERDAVFACPVCGELVERILSAPHVEPDGIYSHCPNVGSEEAFVRKRDALKEGRRGYVVTDDHH